MGFLQRYGRARQVQLGREEVSEALKTGLLDLLTTFREGDFMTWHDVREHVCRVLRRRPDPSNWSEYPNIHGEVEQLVYNSEWDEFYAICEVVPRACNVANGDERINAVLEQEGSQWRMTDGEIGPIFPDEVQSVLAAAKAAVASLEAAGPKVHLDKARRHLSPSTGDKENAVKEAVSALEAAIKVKSGLDDFDAGLKLLKQQKLLRGAWPAAIQALYQYASREDQIRHGSPDVSELTQEEAVSLVGLAAVLTQHIAGLPNPR